MKLKLRKRKQDIKKPTPEEIERESNQAALREIIKQQSKFDLETCKYGFGVRLTKQSTGLPDGYNLAGDTPQYVFFLDLYQGKKTKTKLTPLVENIGPIKTTEEYELHFQKMFRFSTHHQLFESGPFGSMEPGTSLKYIYQSGFVNYEVSIQRNKVTLDERTDVYALTKEKYEELVELFDKYNINLDVYR